MLAARTEAQCRSKPLPADWFDKLFEETQAPLARHTRRFAPCPDDVQEIMQEAYLRVFCVVQNSQKNDHQPKALLYTTSRNIAISRSRHLQVVKQKECFISVAEELRCAIADTEQEVSTQEKLARLRRVLASLPPRCRQVIELRIEEGLGQRAIATRLGIAESTVEKHLAQGLRRCAANIDN